MSLIEEALRKQREETERTKPGGSQQHAAQPPPVPEPPPAPPPAQEQESGTSEPPPRKTWTLLLMAGLGTFVLLILVVCLLVFGFGLWRTPATESKPAAAASVKPAVPVRQPAAVQPRPDAPTTHATATPAAAATGLVATAVSSNQPATPEPTSPPPVAAVTVPVATTAAAPAVAVASAQSNVFPVLGSDTPTSAPPAVVAEPAKPLVVWPKLTVFGLIGGTGGRKGAVIINGQMFGIGDTVEGVKIISIDKDGAHLKFAGETRVLKVGGTTE